MELRLRPSSSKRWLACPSSILLEARQPVVLKTPKELFHANQGTAAHELLEACIVNGWIPDNYLGEQIRVFDVEQMTEPAIFEVSQEMVDGVQVVLDYIDGIERESQYSELAMEHSKIEGFRGTADFVAYNGDATSAEIVDLKYGTSTVQAVNRKGEINPQLLCYATLLCDKLPNLQNVRLTIVQPRSKTKTKIRSVDVDRQTIEVFEERVYNARLIADKELQGAPMQLADGSHCYWCRANRVCPLKLANEMNRDFGEGS